MTIGQTIPKYETTQQTWSHCDERESIWENRAEKNVWISVVGGSSRIQTITEGVSFLII